MVISSFCALVGDKNFRHFFKIRIIELHLLGYPQKIVIIKQLKLIITNRWNSIICILKTKHSINMQIKVRLTILKKRIFFSVGQWYMICPLLFKITKMPILTIMLVKSKTIYFDRNYWNLLILGRWFRI